VASLDRGCGSRGAGLGSVLVKHVLLGSVIDKFLAILKKKLPGTVDALKERGIDYLMV
jgi:hypothetical protein